MIDLDVCIPPTVTVQYMKSSESHALLKQLNYY